MSECEIYFLGKLIWTKLLKKNSSQTYPWLSLRFPNLSPNGSVKQLRLLDPGVSEERIVSLLVRKRFGECTLKLKILGNRNIRNPETPVGSSTTTLVFFRYKKHILMIVDASCVWISCAYYMEIYDNGPLPWECKIRGPNISTYGSALLGKITKRCSSHFLRTWILFWGDFFLGTKMSKKELSDLRIWNDRYMTERLKPLIPEDGIFDTKNPSSATAGFCFWATPPQKKTRKKNTQKKTSPQNNTTTPWPPRIPKQSRLYLPSLGIQVRCTTRWNANTRRMRRWLRRNPESFAPAGISCRFGSPKNWSAYPPKHTILRNEDWVLKKPY